MIISCFNRQKLALALLISFDFRFFLETLVSEAGENAEIGVRLYAHDMFDTNMLYDFIIVGGGISGLYAAYELKKKGFTVLLLEKNTVIGGTWNSVQYKTSIYELGPNTILSNSDELLDLIEDLGMEDELLSSPLSSAKRYIYHHRKLIELSSNPLQLLNSGVLSVLGFLRIFLEPFYHKDDENAGVGFRHYAQKVFNLIPKYHFNLKKTFICPLHSPSFGLLGLKRIFQNGIRGLEQDSSLNKEESVKQFCERKFGFELTDVLVKTFLKGVWAGDISKLSASVALSNLVKLEKKTGSVFLSLIIDSFQGFILQISKNLFKSLSLDEMKLESSFRKRFSKKKSILSFENGLQSLTQRMADELSDSLKLNAEVESILKVQYESDENTELSAHEQYHYILKTNHIGGENAGIEDCGQSRQGDFKAKSVIIASQAYVTAKLLADLDSDVSTALANIEYAPIALCAYVLPKSKFKKELKGFGFLSADDSMKVLGSIWASELFPERNLEDEYLHISFIGGALNTSIVKNAEIGVCEQSQAIWNELSSELTLIYKDWAKEPLQKEDFRLLDIKIIDKAIPQLNLGHEKLIEDIRKQLRDDNPKIHLVGNYLKGVSIKDALRSVTELNSYLA
ncbi:MAG: protoporphyrinogen oxidase [bacterium]